MIHLLLADLRHHASNWLWICIIATAAGACTTGEFMIMHGSLDSAQAAGDPMMIEAAIAIASTTISLVAMAAMAVLSSTSSFVVNQRERDHGLWRALGMQPGVLQAIILGQLGVAGVLGTLLGTLFSWPVAQTMLTFLVDQEGALPGTTLRWEPLDLAKTLLIVAGSVVVGGWASARRAAVTTEVDLINSRGASSRRWSVGRVLGLFTRLATAVGCVVSVGAAWYAAHTADELPTSVGAAFLGALALLTLLCVVVPWIVPATQRMLALLPAPGPAWQVATRTAAVESRRSSATVLPFLLAIGFVAIFFGLNSTSVGNVEEAEFVVVFGLPFATSWVGGVAVIAMSANRRRRDAALLRAAGATEAEIAATQVLEGIIHAASSIVLGLVVSLGTSVLLAEAFKMPLSEVISRTPVTELGVVSGMTLVTTCLAVVFSSRAQRAESLGQTLRARE